MLGRNKRADSRRSARDLRKTRAAAFAEQCAARKLAPSESRSNDPIPARESCRKDVSAPFVNDAATDSAPPRLQMCRYRLADLSTLPLAFHVGHDSRELLSDCE
jgi:hypothetical protein